MDISQSGTGHEPIPSNGRGGIIRLLDALTSHMQERGYSGRSCTEYRQGAHHFLAWLGRRRARAVPFAEHEVSAFLARHSTRCRCPGPRGGSRAQIRAALRQLVLVARQMGNLASPPAPGPATPIEDWLAAFDNHLRIVRGLAVATRAQQTRYVHEFLDAVFGVGPVDFAVVSVRVLVEFVTKRAAPGTRQAAKHAATALRSFLRFLVLRGACKPELVAAVPTVPDWHARFLPIGLPAAEVDSILRATDAATAIGRRDHAVTLCMVRLGLRAGEVAQLTLDDLDWRAGTLRVSSPKEGRGTVLPVPADVGRAIAAYARHGRPAGSDRHVFVTHNTPAGRPLSASAVCAVVRRACRRAGLPTVGHGAHALRHTLAGAMVQSGSTLKEVADVLRHRHLDTTAIYTKVDVSTLATVGLPWPEVTS